MSEDGGDLQRYEPPLGVMMKLVDETRAENMRQHLSSSVPLCFLQALIILNNYLKPSTDQIRAMVSPIQLRLATSFHTIRGDSRPLPERLRCFVHEEDREAQREKGCLFDDDSSLARLV